MTKVLYNGKEIELDDDFEPGFMELDMLTPEEQEDRKLEDTMELQPVNLEDTMELDISDLEDTQELDLGEINE